MEEFDGHHHGRRHALAGRYRRATPVVQAAAALQPMLREYHEEIEREQRLPNPLVEQLRAAGFYRMVIPRSLGGLQVDPLTYLRVVELLAEGAGSVGWNLANNSIGQLVTLGLPDEGVAGDLRPRGRHRHRRHRGAGRRAGGAGRRRLPRHRALELRQRLPGEPPGCSAASRSSTAASRAASPDGGSLYWRGVFPRAEAEIVPGSWDVAGLRGTGSFDWTVDDVFLPERRTMVACRRPARQPVGALAGRHLRAAGASAGSGRTTAR